jgi:LysR family transcriptional regulator, glycine cleavage system transcriptional activator
MILRRRIPSPNALFVFEAAARLGSFSRAASELNITQPAVSHAVATLEEHLGQKLFQRTGPRVELTENGTRLSRVTTRSFHAIEGVLGEIEGRDSGREVVMLSISSSMATHWLLPRYDRFRDSFPDTDLQFQLIPGSVGGPLHNCDLGLRVAVGEDSRKLEGRFAPERILVAGTPAYLQEHGTFEAPLKAHTLIELSEHWFDWTEYTARIGQRVPSHYERMSFSDYAVVLQAALSGQGLVLAWTSVASRLLISGMLVKACERIITTDRAYHFVTSGQRVVRPIVNQVRDWLIAEMREEERQLAAMFA